MGSNTEDKNLNRNLTIIEKEFDSLGIGDVNTNTNPNARVVGLFSNIIKFIDSHHQAKDHVINLQKNLTKLTDENQNLQKAVADHAREMQVIKNLSQDINTKIDSAHTKFNTLLKDYEEAKVEYESVCESHKTKVKTLTNYHNMETEKFNQRWQKRIEIFEANKKVFSKRYDKVKKDEEMMEETYEQTIRELQEKNKRLLEEVFILRKQHLKKP